MEVEKTDPSMDSSFTVCAGGATGVTGARFARVKLDFDHLQKGKSFSAGILGLQIAEEQAGHRAKFDSQAGICLP